MSTREPASALLKGGLGIGAATTFASGANYLSNVVLGRVLGPAQFADAALVVSGLLLLGAVALGLQLHAARTTAAGATAARVRRISRRAAITGLAGGALVVAASPFLAGWLNMGSALPLTILGLGVPVYFVMAVARGVTQAHGRFGRLAASLAAEAAVRLIVTAACVVGGLGPSGAAIALVASFLAAALPCRAEIRNVTHVAPVGIDRPDGGAIGATVLLLFGQVVISNGDLWVVAARVPDDAGTYAAVALIGRLVFIAAWSVITVVFPSLVTSGHGSAPPRLLARAFAATGVLGGVATVVAAAFAQPLMTSMVGDGFGDGARLLGPYALATTLFVLANLVAVADLAAGKLAGPAVIAVGAVVQTVVLFRGAAAGIGWVVWAQVVVMAALLGVAVVARHIRSWRTIRAGAGGTRPVRIEAAAAA